MVGGTLSFLGPSTLLSTIFRLLERPRWRRRRLFVVNRDDEPRLPRQVEAVDRPSRSDSRPQSNYRLVT
jgi:hypothetical protein